MTTVSNLLDHRVIQRAIERAFLPHQADERQQIDQRARLERELEAVEAKLGRLVEALVSGGPMETVIAQIKAEEERKRALVAECEALQAGSDSLDYDKVRKDIEQRTADVEGVLQRQTAQSRQMLRKLLATARSRSSR